MKKLLIFIALFFVGLSQSFAFDISDIAFDQNTTTLNSNAFGTYVSDDGLNAYFSMQGSVSIQQYSMSIANDPSTLSYVRSFTPPTWTAGITFSPDLSVMVFSSSNGNSSHLKSRIYSLSIPGNISTASLTYTISYSHNYYGSSFSSDGNKLFFSDSGGTIREYTLESPYLMNANATYIEYETGLPIAYSIQILGNGDSMLANYNGINDYIIHLNTPNTFANGFTYDIFTDLGNATSSYIYDNGSQLLAYNNTIGKNYLTNGSFGPPELTDAYINSVDSLENGVNITFTCEQDCDYNVGVYNDEETLLYNNATGTLSGSLTPQTVFIPVSLLYQGQYKAIGGFYDINNPVIEIIDIRGFTYWYNPDPNNFVVGDFTFSPYGFTRLDNGFEITNLDVDPKGGVFFLNIVGPNGFETGLYTTDFARVWDDHGEADIYSTGYGSGSINIVTYPYHRWAGDYELLISFQYPGLLQEIYPFGTGALNYSITAPEWSEEDSQVYICDTNDDGIVSDLELADCQENLEGGFLENMWGFYSGIKTLFRELMKTGNVEKKEWGFFLIPQTHAESMTDRIPLQPTTEDNILTDFYGFFKGFIIFAFLILTVIVIIVILKKSPGST